MTAERHQLRVHKFGRMIDVQAATPTDIWTYGGVYTYMTSASTMYASSDDTNDAVTITVEGLDGDYMLQKESVVIAGFTFVELTNTYLRVFRAYVTGATAPAGNLYISDDNTDTDGGADGIPDTVTNIKAQIEAGTNQTLMALYTTPADFRRYELHEWSTSISSDGSNAAARGGRIELRTRSEGGVFQVKDMVEAHSHGGLSVMRYHFPRTIEPKTDITVFSASVSKDDANVTGTFDIVGWN